MTKPCPCCGAAVAPLAVSIAADGMVTFEGRSVHLSPSELRLLQPLLAGFPGVVSHDALYEAYTDGLDEPPLPEVVKCHACRINRGLRTIGLVVETHFGTARSLRPTASVKASATPRCPACGSRVAADTILVDEGRGIVSRSGQSVHVPRGRMAILRVLLDRRSETISKRELFNRYCAERFRESRKTEKALEVQICSLRKDIAPLGIAILTRWGTGYALEAIEGSRSAVLDLQERALQTSRFCRLRPDGPDRAVIGQLRREGLAVTQIAARLRLTYRAVREALEQLDGAESDPDTRTDAQVAALETAGAALRQAS